MHLRRVDEDPTENLPPPQPFEKMVVFVRHGQSVANTVCEGMKMSLSQQLRDSKLSPLGEQQAAELGAKWVATQAQPQLILASPMTRALQTACLAFEALPLPIVAWPVCTEYFEEYPECQGRRREELEAEPKLTGEFRSGLKKWRDVHLDNVVGDWWSCAGDLGRLDAFMSWLRWCPETRIVVVCHWGFITYLMEHAGYAQRALLSLHNCTQVRTIWHPEAPALAVPAAPGAAGAQARQYAVWLEPDRASAPAFIKEFDAFTAAAKADARVRDCVFLARRGGRLHVALSAFAALPFEAVQRVGMALRTEGLRLMGRGAGVEAAESLLSWSVGADRLSCVVREEKTLYAALQFDSASLQRLCETLAGLPAFAEQAAAVRTGGTYAITLADGPQGRAVHLSDFAHILVPEKFPLLCSALGVGRPETASEAASETASGPAPGSNGDGAADGWRETVASLRWYLCLMESTEGADGVCTIRREPGMVVPLWQTS